MQDINQILKRTGFFMVFTMVLACILSGQNTQYTYRNFDDRDGIKSSTMFGMVQDKNGFIWMGTDNGLHRFDGHQFEVFKSPIDTKTNNISNQLREILYDSTYNRLWLLSFTDFQYLDLKDYTFHRWFDFNKYKVNVLSYQKYMAKVYDDEIIFSVDGAIYHYSIKSKSIYDATSIYKVPKVINKNYAILKSINKDKVAAIYPNGIIIKNLIDGETQLIKANDTERFTDLIYDDEHIYIAASAGLLSYNLITKKRTIKTFPYKVKNTTFKHFITKLYHFDQNSLILTGMSGHILFKKKDHSYKYYHTGEGDFENRVSASNFLKDREGNLWKSSIIDYCNVLYHQNSKMYIIDSIINEEGINIEPYRNIRINDSLFAFCGSGMNGIGFFNHKIGNYKVINNHLNKSQVVYDVMKLNNRIILTASRDNVFSLDIKDQKFLPLKFNINGKIEDIAGVKYFIKIDANRVVAVNATSIYTLDLSSYQAKKMDIDQYLKGKQDQTNYGLHPFLYFKDKLYLGGNKYLYEVDLKTQNIGIAWYSDEQLEKDILKYVRKMIVDKYGKIWISTWYNGVLIFDPSIKSWTTINTENSCLSNNNVSEMALDPFGRMWLINVEIIHLFDTKTIQCLSAKDKREGFPKLGYSVNIEKGDHVMTFNNYPKIQVLDFKDNPINTVTRPTFITSIKINERELIKVPLHRDTNFSFLPIENNISFSFTNLCFNNSHNNQYKYKLEAIDTAWVTSAEPYVEYKRLPSGTYTFSLQSSNNEGIWDPHIQKITFSIQPIFYKSWWFILLTLGSGLALIYFYYKLNIKRLRNEAKITADYQKKISEIEMKALRAQMNPHFIFNSLNSIQKFIFEKDEYAASQYLTKFSRLIRLILEHSNQEFVTISSEMEMLKYYIDMERLRFSDKFEYTITKSDDVSDSWLIPSMVIQPHVENAIWHGLMHKEDDCTLSVNITMLDDQTIQVVIEDNGVGRTKAEEMKSKQTLKKKSFGSQISKDRLKYFSELTGKKASLNIEDLYNANGISSGTKVILTLPIKNHT